MANDKVFKINGLKYPAADNIKGRTTTIWRSMACTLLMREGCSKEEEKLWMKFFPDNKCAYCGKNASHLDHLHALIINKIPIGYGTEPANLVPCCKDCNQPKGNLYWEDYMRSTKCNHVGDSTTNDPNKAMENRIANLNAFQKAMPPKKVVLSENAVEKWKTIQNDFDDILKRTNDELLELKKELYEK